MRVFENISLRQLNSFGVDSRAARLVEWERADELRPIFGFGASGVASKVASRLASSIASSPVFGRWLPLGGGNNILFVNDFDGTLVKSVARGIIVTGETVDTISVRAEAGVDWGDFVAWCVERGVWGVENLSGIPGTVGAAPIQNIGAYGAEVKDIITSVECFAVDTGSTLTLAAAHCGFGYRDSVFKRTLRGRVFVTAVDFSLSKVPRPNLRYQALADKVAEMLPEGAVERVSERAAGSVSVEAVEAVGTDLSAISRAVIALRNSKLPDPKTMGNAGSFFKNPVIDNALAREIADRHPDMPLWPAGSADGAGKTKLSAGWLIEHAGWKGRAEGRVGIHPAQALIVVNLGGATGREIVDFTRKVASDVREKFGVELTPEVNIIQ